MNKTIQKLLALLLAILMIVSMVACNNKKDDDTKKPQDDTSSVDSSSDDDTSSDDTSSDDTVSDNTSSDDTTSIDDSLLPSMPNTDSSSKDDTSSEEENEAVIEVEKVDKDDFPYVKYPAYLMNPMKSAFDKETDALRDKILNLPDKLPETVTGTVWYISNNGDDTNTGKSPDQALQSFFGLEFHRNEIVPGDAVLFERGSVFRGALTVKNGVYYGAYGKGNKPCIYGSAHNYAKANWTKKHDNLWLLEAPFDKDVGTIFFNHGESTGFKKDSKYDLENNGDFWCDPYNNFRLYVYMDQNPAKKYKNIEIGVKEHIITITDAQDVTIENLCLKYTGAHGIGGGGKNQNNITIRGCEIGFIGGSYLSETLRFGNGIEFYAGGKNVLCEYNWIYHVYDSGITNQGGNFFENLKFTNNLIEYNGMGSFEYWLAGEWNVNNAKDVYFTDNICRFAGYCWAGEQRPDKVATHIRSDTSCRNTMFNFHIERNIFDQALNNLVEIGGTCLDAYDWYESQPEEDMKMPSYPEPILSGNTFAQKHGDFLGTYFGKAGITFDDEMETFIKVYMKDKEAIIYEY